MEWLRIATSTELVRVRTEDILFVQADGNYSDLHLISGKSRKMTFKLHYFDDVFQRLEHNFFVRVGKSLIVNQRHIFVINLPQQELLLKRNLMGEDIKLKASKEALKELKTLLEQENDKP